MGIGGEGGTFSSAIICSVYHVVPLVLFNLCLFTWNPRRYRMKARSQRRLLPQVYFAAMEYGLRHCARTEAEILSSG